MTVVVRPYQRVTVSNLAAISADAPGKPAAARAALAIVLSASKATCEPESQLLDIIGAADVASLSAFAAGISGKSCVVRAQTMTVRASFVPNGEIQGDNLIASLMGGKPLLLEWKGAFYVLYGIIYDEHLHSSGQRDNVIRQLLLIDPRYSDERRFVVFPAAGAVEEEAAAGSYAEVMPQAKKPAAAAAGLVCASAYLFSFL